MEEQSRAWALLGRFPAARAGDHAHGRGHELLALLERPLRPHCASGVSLALLLLQLSRGLRATGFHNISAALGGGFPTRTLEGCARSPPVREPRGLDELGQN